MIQFVSHVLPPSSENACSHCGELERVRVQRNRHRTFLPVEELIAEELAGVAVEPADHRRKQSPRAHGIGPVNGPLLGRWIEQAQGDAFDGVSGAHGAVTIHMPRPFSTGSTSERASNSLHSSTRWNAAICLSNTGCGPSRSRKGNQNRVSWRAPPWDRRPMPNAMLARGPAATLPGNEEHSCWRAARAVLETGHDASRSRTRSSAQPRFAGAFALSPQRAISGVTVTPCSNTDAATTTSVRLTTCSLNGSGSPWPIAYAR